MLALLTLRCLVAIRVKSIMSSVHPEAHYPRELGDLEAPEGRRPSCVSEGPEAYILSRGTGGPHPVPEDQRTLEGTYHLSPLLLSTAHGVGLTLWKPE